MPASLTKAVQPVLFSSMILISACANNETPADLIKDYCPETRPEMCAAIYDPVCGVTGNGELSTYSSACRACTDTDVIGHFPGPCEDKTRRP
ncbi:MAG: hypothetical protein HUJ31_10400 [Pseudomonadales bacterium]|nr:hypothetical protein [Pseudomonadales bacterium]